MVSIPTVTNLRRSKSPRKVEDLANSELSRKLEAQTLFSTLVDEETGETLSGGCRGPSLSAWKNMNAHGVSSIEQWKQDGSAVQGDFSYHKSK